MKRALATVAVLAAVLSADDPGNIYGMTGLGLNYLPDYNWPQFLEQVYCSLEPGPIVAFVNERDPSL